MTRYLTAFLALTCLLSLETAVRAQYPYGGNPYSRPAVSPYLNLLRGGSSPALNYSTLVRPDIEYRNSINQLSGQSLANQQAIAGLSQSNNPSGPLTTGAIAGFGTHLTYFGSLSGGPSAYNYGGSGGGFGGATGQGGVGFGGAGFGGNRGGAGFSSGAAPSGGGFAPPARRR